MARLIGAETPEIVFTSGATESNNIAIKGVARFYKKKKIHIVTSQTEHKCVLDSCRALKEHEGFDITYLPVQKNGLIDLKVCLFGWRSRRLIPSNFYLSWFFFFFFSPAATGGGDSPGHCPRVDNGC